MRGGADQPSSLGEVGDGGRTPGGSRAASLLGTGTGGWVVNRGVSCVAGRELGVQDTGGQTGI